MKRALCLVVAVVALAACSGSDAPQAPDDTPGLDRIDGPAVVDPSYDPMEVDPLTSVVTDGEG